MWDLPTRCFHWLLAVAVIAAVATGLIGGNAMFWHLRIGLLVLALLAFRLVWGFVGGHWSRFVNFVYGPRSLRAYLQGDRGPGGRYGVGHSPLGAAAVWAMLGVLVVQVATGLVADDEIATTGPLNRFVAAATGIRASAWHGGPGKLLVIVMSLLHVAAVLYYLWRHGRNLIAPMIHGDLTVPAGTPASNDGASVRGAALAIAMAAGALAWWLASLAAP